MKNLKKGVALGVAVTFVSLGLVSPAIAAEKASCDDLTPMSARIACLQQNKDVVEATDGISNFDRTDEDLAKEAVDTYRARPWASNYKKAVEATKNVPSERARLEEAKKNIEGATEGLTEFDSTDEALAKAKKAVDTYRARPWASNYKKAVEATKNIPTERARLEEAKKNVEGATEGLTEMDKSEAAKAVDTYRARPWASNYEKALKATENDPAQRARLEEAKKNIDGATEDLTDFDKSEANKAVDAFIKRPYKRDLYEAAVKATENDPAQRARLEEAKKNIEDATEDLHKTLGDTKVPDYAPMTEDKPVGVVPAEATVESTVESTVETVEATPESKEKATEKKSELANTGVAIGTLAGLAALSALIGAVAIRNRRNA